MNRHHDAIERRRAAAPFSRAAGALLVAAALACMPRPAGAQVLKRGFGSALGGAALGSLLDGQEGARKGAAIGGTIGVIRGAQEKGKREAAQAEARKRQEAERQQLAQAQQPTAAPSPVADPGLVTEIQKSLVRLGLDPGDVNGELSPATENAIKQYQTKHSLLVDGRVSQELLKHMLKNGG